MENFPKDLIKGIDYLWSQLLDADEDYLLEVAQSDEVEELVFNLLDKFRWKLKDGEKIDQALLEKLFFLAEERLKYLKTKFAGKSVGRNTPGKMEYDTTLQSLRLLRDQLSS